MGPVLCGHCERQMLSDIFVNEDPAAETHVAAVTGGPSEGHRASGVRRDHERRILGVLAARKVRV